MKISTVETERVCYTCGKPGHLARECRRTKSTQPMEDSRGIRATSRNWGPPSRNWGPPSRNWGPPPRNWGPPMARARENQALEQMGREEMGPSSGAVPKRRQKSRFSASGFSRNEENKRQLN
ncbi:hypothetical protein JTB14_028034 [Gonioctena quinquepunctata]|nr:hypothetical protein JTB14_028034 [Gonioctena quinquepunctata]